MQQPVRKKSVQDEKSTDFNVSDFEVGANTVTPFTLNLIGHWLQLLPLAKAANVTRN